MPNIFIRTISGLAYVIFVLGACFSGTYGQVFLACFLSVAAIIEWMQIIKSRDLAFPTALIIGIIFLSIYCFTGIFALDSMQLSWLKALVILLVTVLFINLAFNSKNFPTKLFHSIFGLVYIGLPMIILPMVPEYGSHNYPWMLASVFILLWCNDTFAYLVGRSFGKHKLYPRLSPNKTWEGFFGGVLSTLLAALVMSYYLPFLPLIGWLGLGSHSSDFWKHR